MALNALTKAPDFALASTNGKLFTLSQTWADTPGIIYFYPKDFTPGCTLEACAFRDHYQDLAQWGIPVVGISTDSVETHKRFQKAHNIPFELLSDPEARVSVLYKAKLPFLPISKRVTYVLDSQHTIRLVVENLFAADAHLRDVLTHLRQEYQKKVKP